MRMNLGFELSLVNSGMVERQFSGLRTLVEQSVDMSQSTKSDTVARCLAVTNELKPLLLAFSSFPLRTERCLENCPMVN